MYERVKAWVFERGGRLMYLGGNGLNCEVEFLDDGRPCAAARNARRRPASGSTGPSAWRAASPARSRSEANLLGVVYTDDRAS